MSRTTMRAFLSGTGGAVAPTVALALVGLIAIGGVAFDYSRLVGMHSELQNAADQAALAAATQLDGKDGARAAATTAASNLVANSTLISDDGDGAGVAIATVVFYQDKAKTPATSDADANYAEVTVDGREVFYALTPIVGAFSSGEVTAKAMAGLGSSICKVPPVMMCNPAEAVSVGADFDADGLRGAGVKLISGAPNFPGNFGFLDNGYSVSKSNPTPDLARMLGGDTPPGNCLPAKDEVGLTPGNRDVVFNAYNTRFDIDTNGGNTCPSGVTCSAALNTRKDLVRKNPAAGNSCGTTGNGWMEPTNKYRPVTTTPLASGYPDTMGHPRDICHAVSFDGVCSGGIIGDKLWDRDAYFLVNYGWNHSTWIAQTGLGSNASRYEVYKWELGHTGYLTSQPVAGGTAFSQPVCRPAASGTIPDRRRMTIAVVNCKDQATKIAGNDKVKVLKWVDVFAVEPSYDRGTGTGKRTTGDQVYVEIIGENKVAGGADAGQVVRRDVPYLVE